MVGPTRSEPARTVGVVVNPDRTAGSEDFVADLRKRGLDVDVAIPASADAIADAVHDFVAAGVDVVAAVGGDGTQRTAAARLIETGIPLAIVPGGTVNLLGKVLGTETVDDAVRAVTEGSIRTIDLGRIGEDVFVLNASTGWDAATIERVDDGLKRFGRIGYVAAGVTEWFRARPRRVTVVLDGSVWYEGAALTVLVLNVGQRGSASLQLAPDAELDDGRLDVLVLRRHSVVGLARTAWSILRGRPAPSTDVRTAQGAAVDVAWDTAAPVQCDGDERGRAAETTYRSVPRALQVIVPPANAS